MSDDDKQLTQDVLAELAWEPSVAEAHIGVSVNAGLVTLSGHVNSFAEKHGAETAACRVKGVKGVAEEIEVRLPFDMRRGDEEIAASAITRLAWDVSVPSDSVAVKVENGWITLTGQVDGHYQKRAAALDVRGLFGVVGITDEINIKPRVDTSSLSDDIMHALHRSWLFDPRTITVAATDGKVQLTGTVHSWHDRELAAETAWTAPGVTTVVNDIVIA
jgi:osmotically-inducible protein OsmY